MCQALKELMKEEIAEERADEKVIDIKHLMKNMKMTAEQAMNALGIPVTDQSKYSAMLTCPRFYYSRDFGGLDSLLRGFCP